MEELSINLILLLFFMALSAGAHALFLPDLAVAWLQWRWPVVQARVSGQVKHEQHQGKTMQYLYNNQTDRYEWKETRSQSDSYFPLLKFDYSFDKQALRSDNKAAWNHSMWYTRRSSQRTLKRITRQRGLVSIRVNPHAPGEIFLGWSYFPFVRVLLALAFGLLMSAVSFSTLADLLGLDLSNRQCWQLPAASSFCFWLGLVLARSRSQ